jgi:hypothetical protein
MSLFELYFNTGISERLLYDIKEHEFDVDEDILVDNIFYSMSYSFICLAANNLSTAIQTLNNLLNNHSVKNLVQSEIESKLFLSLLYILTGKTELSEGLLRSVAKRVTENDLVYAQDYTSLMKLLRIASSNKKESDKLTKINELSGKLNFKRNNSFSFLRNIHFDLQLNKRLSNS